MILVSSMPQLQVELSQLLNLNFMRLANKQQLKSPSVARATVRLLLTNDIWFLGMVLNIYGVMQVAVSSWQICQTGQSLIRKRESLPTKAKVKTPLTELVQKYIRESLFQLKDFKMLPVLIAKRTEASAIAMASKAWQGFIPDVCSIIIS